MIGHGDRRFPRHASRGMWRFLMMCIRNIFSSSEISKIPSDVPRFLRTNLMAPPHFRSNSARCRHNIQGNVNSLRVVASFSIICYNCITDSTMNITSWKSSVGLMLFMTTNLRRSALAWAFRPSTSILLQRIVVIKQELQQRPRSNLMKRFSTTVDGGKTTSTDSKPVVNEEAYEEATMDDIIGLCKRRGFVFPSSEIYNGFAGFYDYGPLGCELKRNVKEAWWKQFVTRREDVVGLDSSIIHNPQTWKSSGTCGAASDV